MITLLMSIREKFAELILDGRKTIELRRTRPAFPMTSKFGNAVFICYGGRIHGYCVIDGIESCTLMNQQSPKGSMLIKGWQAAACVTDREWRDYEPKYLWHIGATTRFKTPIPLASAGFSRAPQSWQYLSQNQVHAIEEAGKAGAQ